MLAWVKWAAHAKSSHYRGTTESAPDGVMRDAGEGALIGFTSDHESQPCGVVVEQRKNGKTIILGPELKTIRLSDLQFDRWPS